MSSASPAIRGIRRSARPARPAARRWRSRPACCRLAQGTDFGCSVRMPAAFCGIVGIRPTPGLTPNYPMPLAWDPGQVHGPLARTAEDAALMLDAMVGYSRLSPISVAPPWQSALAEVAASRDAKGLRIAYVTDIAGIGVDTEIDAICRKTAMSLSRRRRQRRGDHLRCLRRQGAVSGLARPMDGRPATGQPGQARAVRRPISKAMSKPA